MDCEAAAPVRSLTPHLRGLTTSAVQTAVQAAVVLHNTHCPLARFGERANHPIQDSVDLSSAHQASDVQRAKPSTNQPSPITLKPDHRRMRGAHLSRSETKSKTAALRVNLMPKISEVRRATENCSIGTGGGSTGEERSQVASASGSIEQTSFRCQRHDQRQCFRDYIQRVRALEIFATRCATIPRRI